MWIWEGRQSSTEVPREWKETDVQMQGADPEIMSNTVKVSTAMKLADEDQATINLPQNGTLAWNFCTL